MVVQARGVPPNLKRMRLLPLFSCLAMTVLATIPFVTVLKQVVKAKKRWGVSVSALAHRLHRLNVLSDWQYRTFCIQINRTYGDNEPDGLAPERSSVWQMVLTELWKEGIARHHIASDLSIPDSEMENLLFGLMGDVRPPERQQGKTALRTVN